MKTSLLLTQWRYLQKTVRLTVGIYNNAFIASQVDTSRFNQIKGRSLTGHFKNNELYKINIKGNGEALYYLLDGENVAGVDQSNVLIWRLFLIR